MDEQVAVEEKSGHYHLAFADLLQGVVWLCSNDSSLNYMNYE